MAVTITLTELGGVRVNSPKLFNDEFLKPMQYGLLLTDGSFDSKSRPEMSTTQLWQSVAWLMAWPGRNHVFIDGLSINDDDVRIKWHLIATDYKGAIESKARIAEEVLKLGDETFTMFLLFAILGDGDVNVKEKRVRLTIGDSKYVLWSGIIDRMGGAWALRITVMNTRKKSSFTLQGLLCWPRNGLAIN